MDADTLTPNPLVISEKYSMLQYPSSRLMHMVYSWALMCFVLEAPEKTDYST